jgi:tetratricopeptide (TPR) repeat protein
LDGERTPQRSFSKISKSKVKDRDLHSTSVKMSAVVAGMLGALMGVALGFLMMDQYGFGLWAIPMCMAGMGLLLSSSLLLLIGSATSTAKGLYNPSGSATPHKKEYSFPESLAMRGLYDDAISAFELVIVEEKSTDPTPFLRIARIYRDDIQRYEDAARWFNRALRESDMHTALQSLVRKELVELYRVRLDMPQEGRPDVGAHRAGHRRHSRR